MTERMKTFIYCAITAVVTTIVVSAGQPRAALADAHSGTMVIKHLITFGVEGTAEDFRTLIIRHKDK
ncbi:MAG: hypothetical protein IID34_18285 [Planctomycetes bacterium]|nr:hypothetical protein [Planctomycetota bacterium]